MFSAVNDGDRKRKLEIENAKLREKLMDAEANIDYLSMMTGVDMPEEASIWEGGESNE